jgi:hypothetical protein
MQHSQAGGLPKSVGIYQNFCQIPGIATTVDIDYIKAHYYGSHTHINPTGVIPRGPELDYSTPHGKAFPTTTKRHLVASPDGRNESLLINQDATLERLQLVATMDAEALWFNLP